MPINTINGQMLEANLERDGVDLAVNTNLLYIDVINSRIGVRTATPAEALDIAGNAKITGNMTITGNLDLGTTLDVEFLSLAGNTITSTSGDLVLTSTAGNINVNSKRIVSIADPVNPGDAVSKGYLESVYSDIAAIVVVDTVGSLNTNFQVLDDNISPGSFEWLVDGVSVGTLDATDLSVGVNIDTTGTMTANTFDTGSIQISGDSISGTTLDLSGPNLSVGGAANRVLFNDASAYVDTSALFTYTSATDVLTLNNFTFDGANRTISTLTNGALTITTGTGTMTLDSSAAVRLPTGTTAQRPGTPAAGMMRWNSDNTELEAHNSSTWGNMLIGPSDVYTVPTAGSISWGGVPSGANNLTNKAYVDNLVVSGTVWRDPIRDPDLVGVTGTEPVSPQTDAGYIATAGGTWTGSVTVVAGDYVYWTGSAWIVVQNIAAGDRFIIAGENATIESSLYDAGFRGSELIEFVSGAFGTYASWIAPHDAGYQVIVFTVPKTGTDATGFANDATVYSLDVTTDVGSGSTLSQIQVTGSAAQTFTSLISEINTDLDSTFGASNVQAVLEAAGDIHIYNNATGDHVLIAEGTAGATTGMLATLTNFSEILASLEDGTTVIVSDLESVHYGHTYTYSDEGNTWTEISGPGSIGAGTNLAYDGNTLNVSPQGAGSGLDADTLDGIDSLSFLRSDAVDSASSLITFNGGLATPIDVNMSAGTLNIRQSTALSGAILENTSGTLYIQNTSAGDSVQFETANNVGAEQVFLEGVGTSANVSVIIRHGGTSVLQTTDTSINIFDGITITGYIEPSVTNTYALGTSSLRWQNVYANAMNVSGNITVTGTVDGRDVSVDGTKLDGIEDNATADQSAAEILAALLTVDGSLSLLDADLLDGQQGTYYLDWTNVTNKPDPTITLGGDLTGSITLTDLVGGTLTAAVVDNSHNHVAANVTDLTETVQDIAGAMFTGNTENGITATYQDADGTIDLDVNDPLITLSGDVTGSATMTNLGNVEIVTTLASGGDAVTLDGLDSTQFLRSDAADSATATITFTQVANTTLTEWIESTNDRRLRMRASSGGGLELQPYFSAAWQSTYGLGFDFTNSRWYFDAAGAPYVGTDEIWHAGNDGSGSGLDADTLDTLQATSFLRSDATDTASGALTFTGSATFSGSTTINNGVGGDEGGQLEFTKAPNGTMTVNPFMDVYLDTFRLVGNPGGTTRVLTFDFNNAGGTVWHSGNDGGGSGLDADTLDTLQATSFLRSDAADTHSGTITPNVTNTINLGSASLVYANIYGTTIHGEATSAQYADLAELYTADAEILPGTVVCFGGTEEITMCQTDMDRRVAGVVSTTPAYLMNSSLDAEFVVALALQGRVPCKVSGTIVKGDLLVSDGNGGARAEENPTMGSVIGKALENSEGDAIIEIVVGRL